MGSKEYWVYILTNPSRSTLYTGVTNDLDRRLAEHRNSNSTGFTGRYKVQHLVYTQQFDNIVDAIAEEKRIKAGSRKKKEDLISKHNPSWHDLAPATARSAMKNTPMSLRGGSNEHSNAFGGERPQERALDPTKQSGLNELQ